MTDFPECTGITLASYPLKEADALIHLFTKERGVLKLVLPRGNRLRSRLHPFAEPLVEGEFVYKEGRSELFRCEEARLLRSSLPFRNSLEVLEAAFEMIRQIRKSQLLWKPAPLLYQLFSTLLNTLPKASHPQTIQAAFTLKLLRHEGHVQLLPRCTLCQKELEQSYYFNGELYCLSHQPLQGISLAKPETLLLIQLSEETQLKQLLSFNVDQLLCEKIKLIFGTTFDERKNAKGGT